MDEFKEELEMYRGLYYSCKDKLAKEREVMKKLLELSYRIKWAEDEKKVWIEAENVVKTFKWFRFFNSFGLAQTLKRRTALSMFYIACCVVVLMKHNGLRLTGVFKIKLKG